MSCLPWTIAITFPGHAATGKQFRQMQMHFVHLNADGLATDHWAVRDDLGMMGQLGLMG